ncbi:MAG: SRPBCC family protein [Acidimicrobiales bacterium]
MFDLANVAAEEVAVLAAPPDAVWDAATDLTKTPERSIEARETAWVPPHTGPQVGAVFRGVNQRGDWAWTVECHVTAAERPSSFEWNVLYAGELSSTWWYRIQAAPDGAEVRHGFQHGPGPSGLRAAMERRPDAAQRIADARVEELRTAMRRTLAALEVEARARAALRGDEPGSR